MKKYFICFANSDKKKGRCLAGIEINFVNKRVEIVYEGEHPKWIRPVVYQDLTGIPYEEVNEIDLLDIVEVDITKEVPMNFHSENVYYQSGSIVSTQRLINREEVLDIYVDPYGPLFLDDNNKIDLESAKRLGRSIMLIKVDDFVCNETEYEGKKKFEVILLLMAQITSCLLLTLHSRKDTGIGRIIDKRIDT